VGSTWTESESETHTHHTKHGLHDQQQKRSGFITATSTVGISLMSSLFCGRSQPGHCINNVPTATCVTPSVLTAYNTLLGKFDVNARFLTMICGLYTHFRWILVGIAPRLSAFWCCFLVQWSYSLCLDGRPAMWVVCVSTSPSFFGDRRAEGIYKD